MKHWQRRNISHGKLHCPPGKHYVSPHGTDYNTITRLPVCSIEDIHYVSPHGTDYNTITRLPVCSIEDVHFNENEIFRFTWSKAFEAPICETYTNESC